MTDVYEAARIRLTETPPVACSACCGQYVERQHVDFGAGFDGPMVHAPDNVMGLVAVAVDDLIICEECLTAAAKLIGLGSVKKYTEQVKQLTAQVEEMGERLAGSIALLDKQQETIAQAQSLRDSLRPKR